MKQTSPSSRSLTKQDLVDALKEFKTEFKDEFRKELMVDIDKKFEKSINTKIDIKFDAMELRVEDYARERHSEVLTRFEQN